MQTFFDIFLKNNIVSDFFFVSSVNCFSLLIWEKKGGSPNKNNSKDI